MSTARNEGTGTMDTATALTVTSLKVGYGDLIAVWDISLTATAGRVLAVVGRNGAGKSTLLAGVAGLLPAAGGSVLLGGTDVTTWPAHRRVRHGLGLVRGKQVFRGLSVQENLVLGVQGSRLPRGERPAVIAGILDRFPVLADRLREPAGSLSGGQQQILAIAQAIAARPSVLLVDEPSSGLAPIMVDEVHAALAALAAEGLAVVLVEEQMDDVLSGIAEQVLVVEEGRLALTADPGSLDAAALEELMQPTTTADD
ncbi:ATP-binding cassette domain-containing protein [Nakamurella sp. YIM 132087]|uniref:ATP-binding cassette domain-containing protein n=1 Tax=Nakamurella alba TaxID=2665158 RepID=A0A7K1FSF7_9ACTN|nr:ATP-binding cassette domain-containing protein [Nakamurella alba]MTD16319.1 ATP-binding cassette domain-containing protein [Nakamurella alba]